MKKLFTIALMFILSCSLVACGCQAQDAAPTTVPTTVAPTTAAPTTAATTAPATGVTVPSMDSTIETNIPDPEVTPGITDMTEGASQDETGENADNNADAAAGNRMRR